MKHTVYFVALGGVRFQLRRALTRWERVLCALSPWSYGVEAYEDYGDTPGGGITLPASLIDRSSLPLGLQQYATGKHSEMSATERSMSNDQLPPDVPRTSGIATTLPIDADGRPKSLHQLKAELAAYVLNSGYPDRLRADHGAGQSQQEATSADPPHLPAEQGQPAQAMQQSTGDGRTGAPQVGLADVFSRPECVFNYCPDPVSCKVECEVVRSRRLNIANRITGKPDKGVPINEQSR